MSEFKFEYELNPASRAAAALDNEGQRLSDELEQARHSLRAEAPRVLAAILLTLLIAVALFGFHHLEVIVVLAYVPARGFIRRGAVARLIASHRTARRAERELADWNAIRDELSSLSDQDSDRANRYHSPGVSAIN